MLGLSEVVGCNVAGQFTEPISKMILERDLPAFRFFGEGVGAIGRWLTTLGTALRIGDLGKPAIDALNLLVTGNPATSLAPLLLPAGTTIYFGQVAGSTLPGAVQVFIQTASGILSLVAP